MMKVVINSCFGGFGLSHEGVMRYAELAGLKLYPFRNRRVDGHLDFDSYEPGADRMFTMYSRKPIESGSGWPKGETWGDHELERTDPFLVQVVEELGDKADGECAELQVVEIPDGVDWEIDEYDGNEHIAEKHRTWG
jgi:hypothetical protein